MLYKFLTDKRAEILALTRVKILTLADSRPTSKELERGLPEFYDHLIAVLKKESLGGGKVSPNSYAPSTAHHGKESLRLGYTVSQVVHGYGSICQAITETAEKMGEKITSGEFSTLNLNLDVAIAEAVSGYESLSLKSTKPDSAEGIASLVHELRNTLTSALIAHSMVKNGVVGTRGSTNELLERNLRRMWELLDRSFSEMRLKNNQKADRAPILVIEAVEEVEVTAREEARTRDLTLLVQVDQDLQVNADRNYLVSALSNLVQNAIKFSKKGGTVCVRSIEGEKNIVIEVEDQCGGLPNGKAEELFKPFTQKSENRTGLGLGLSISRRAVLLNEGTLAVRNMPGIGCAFFITFPKIKRHALVN